MTGRFGRRRALLGALACAGVVVLAGCGGAGGESAGASDTTATAPATTATPARTGPLAPGDVITPTAKTPAAVARALKSGKPVVISFLLSGMADDDAVRAALRTVRASAPGKAGVQFIDFEVSEQHDFGDLPTLLGVTGTPAVVVIGRDRAVVNVWSGLADVQMLSQSISDALDTTPAP